MNDLLDMVQIVSDSCRCSELLLLIAEYSIVRMRG